tara:strand:+ start:181 stop:780 length:600 start_codon:yes stop_codon:yes gene_type:complete
MPLHAEDIQSGSQLNKIENNINYKSPKQIIKLYPDSRKGISGFLRGVDTQLLRKVANNNYLFITVGFRYSFQDPDELDYLYKYYGKVGFGFVSYSQLKNWKNFKKIGFKFIGQEWQQLDSYDVMINQSQNEEYVLYYKIGAEKNLIKRLGLGFEVDMLNASFRLRRHQMKNKEISRKRSAYINIKIINNYKLYAKYDFK